MLGIEPEVPYLLGKHALIELHLSSANETSVKRQSPPCLCQGICEQDNPETAASHRQLFKGPSQLPSVSGHTSLNDPYFIKNLNTSSHSWYSVPREWIGSTYKAKEQYQPLKTCTNYHPGHHPHHNVNRERSVAGNADRIVLCFLFRPLQDNKRGQDGGRDPGAKVSQIQVCYHVTDLGWVT